MPFSEIVRVSSRFYFYPNLKKSKAAQLVRILEYPNDDGMIMVQSLRTGERASRTVMTCTRAADHRALDGIAGARLLAAVKQHLEDPRRMLL